MSFALPDDHFTKTWLYHITAVDNLKSIITSNHLYATNHLNQNHISIAHEEVQDRRAKKRVISHPGGVIHDYVPFYFAPRSPMLYVNSMQGIPNARPQDEIIHLVTYAQKIEASSLPFVFYDRHSVVGYASEYSSLDDLNKIDWEIFFEKPVLDKYAKYWQSCNNVNHPKWANRKEIRQAEFLVHRALPWNLIVGIATMTDTTATKAKNILIELAISIPVKVKKEWYY